jgi:hypothetical protein
MPDVVHLTFNLTIEEAKLYTAWKQYLSNKVKDNRLLKVYALEHCLRKHPLPKE